MSREILLLAEALASEKNVDSEIVFDALEFALGIAARKKTEREQMDVRVEINRNTGHYQTYRRWLIVEDEDYTYPELEKTIEQIQEEIPGIEIAVGEYYEEELPNETFGRQAAQTAKQLILQRIRDAEREQILSTFLETREDIISGSVKRAERHGVIVEVAPKLDALLPRSEMLPRENYRSGDKVRALFLRVDEFNGGRKQIILSRTNSEFLRKLFAGGAGNRRRSARHPRSGARSRPACQNRRQSQRPAHRSAGHLYRRTRQPRQCRFRRVGRRAHRHRAVVVGNRRVCDECPLARQGQQHCD